MAAPPHTPVLPRETLELLAPVRGDVVVDCTAGRGGHAALLADAMAGGPGAEDPGVIIAFDLDPANLEAARTRITPTGVTFEGYAESFVRVSQRVSERGLRADVVLADLGISSTQLDDARRGFSFLRDGPLDMRYDPHAARTAADIVATASEAELSRMIFELGEEPLARKIARKLAQTRVREPIETTMQLAELVRQAYGPRAHASRMHPATRTFMALRSAVNEELPSLRMLLDQIVRGAELATADLSPDRAAAGVPRSAAGGWIREGARIAVISFHSLEDRLVKRAFAGVVQRGFATALARRPITAGNEEIGTNPRARSAKLRAIRIGGEPAARGDRTAG